MHIACHIHKLTNVDMRTGGHFEKSGSKPHLGAFFKMTQSFIGFYAQKTISMPIFRKNISKLSPQLNFEIFS